MQIKDTKGILAKLGIEALNPMQERAYDTITSDTEVVLLSPTGTGKTLAFLLPIIATLDSQLKAVQAMILVPSRELAIQIEQVIREMGSGHKANAVYGGQSGYKDKIELKHPPALLVGTPGRIADHIRRNRIDTTQIRTLVLDEFDKSLEVGFSEEMKEIIESISFVQKKVLTSATQKVEIPPFVGLQNATYLDFLKESSPRLQLRSIAFSGKKKSETLVQLLKHIGKRNGIIFCNHKEDIRLVSEALTAHNIAHGCFYGGLEQVERERALIKFRNGTYNLLVATDLAARGIDVPEMDFIVHFQLPHSEEEFVHRNGRSARMQNEGMAYILHEEKKPLPTFIEGVEAITLTSKKEDLSSGWETLFISGGRRDKISKGDIAGLFFKQGKLTKAELGVIELKQDCSFVSVHHSKAKQLIELLNNTRLKKKKVRISLLS
ncbi:MAG: DEAD/DEAH box helicase [Cyclobacteriaceae bacterium]